MDPIQRERARVLLSNDTNGEGSVVMIGPFRSLGTQEYFFGGVKIFLTLFYRMSFHHEMKRCIVQRVSCQLSG